MVNKKLVLMAAVVVVGSILGGCQEPVVKAGVPPPDPNADGGRMRDQGKQGARGGLGLPKQLPKGPY